jgi:raffinose/stachyose/melibiose transport system substrate-binding protein
MRKKMLAAFLTGIMVMSLAGNVYAADDKVTIEMTVWSGEWGDQLDRIMESFNSTHDDIELNITMQSGDYSDFLGTAAATNDWPDIYILTPWTQVQTFAENGRIADLSDFDFTERVYPTALEAATYDGKIYGYPANVEYLGLFYNKDLFEQAGIESVPTTRDEFADACEKLEAAGISPIASTYKESWTLKHLFSVMMSTVVQDDMEGFIDSLNSGEGTFAVDGIDDVFDCADVIRQYSGSNMMDCDSTSGFNALANGTSAMLLTGEFSQAVVAAMDNPPDIGYFALPVTNDATQNKAAVDVGIVYAVSAQTENFDACREVIDFLSDPTIENGYVSIVTEDPGSAPVAMEYTGGWSCSSTEDYAEYATAVT